MIDSQTILSNKDSTSRGTLNYPQLFERHTHMVKADQLSDSTVNTTRYLVLAMLAGRSIILASNSADTFVRHNLIAIGGVAAAMGTVAAMKSHNISGKVVLLGTPAEEGGAGKVKLLEAGACECTIPLLENSPNIGRQRDGHLFDATSSRTSRWLERSDWCDVCNPDYRGRVLRKARTCCCSTM